MIAMLGFHLAAPKAPLPAVSRGEADRSPAASVERRGMSRTPALPERHPSEPAVPPAPSGKPSRLTRDSRLWGLGANELSLPIAGLRPEDLYDSFEEARGGGARAHEALDIMTPRGTPSRSTGR